MNKIKKTKKCKPPTKHNYCQDSSSGGHQGTIFSIDNKRCIKQMTSMNNEIKFYEKHNELVKNNITILKDFIPKYDGICSLKDKEYFIMENLKAGFKKPLAIDIKIGYETVSKTIIKQKTKKLFLIYSKLFKHYILDKALTKTSKYGFRIEGASLPSNIKLKKMDIMRANYDTIFNYYFENDINNDALTNFINYLQKLEDAMKSQDLSRYFFIGASLLFIYDGENHSKYPIMKLIDFENSLILDDKQDIIENEKHANKIRKSITSLINILQKYLNNKMSKT